MNRQLFQAPLLVVCAVILPRYDLSAVGRRRVRDLQRSAAVSYDRAEEAVAGRFSMEPLVVTARVLPRIDDAAAVRAE